MRAQYPATNTSSYPQIGSSRKETLEPAHPSDLHSSEWEATAYHRLSDPQLSWGRKVLSYLKLPGDELVLDAGCGTGRLTAELLKRLPEGRVMAVDHSEDMLRAAREYLRPRFGDRVMFVRADLQTLRMEERVDDIFTCSAPGGPGVFSRFITTEPSPSSTCSFATLVPSPAGSAKRLIYAVC